MYLRWSSYNNNIDVKEVSIFFFNRIYTVYLRNKQIKLLKDK